MKTNKAPVQGVRAGMPVKRITIDIVGELPLT